VPNLTQQLARRSRHLVEGPFQHRARQLVRGGKVGQRSLDVHHHLAVDDHLLVRALVLVKKRHRLDQPEVLPMIAPRA
jgi:hypothetical protein